MIIEQILQKIHDVGIIPVIRAESFAEAMQAVEAIAAGGIPIVEVTMTVPGAVSVIREVARSFGSRALVGAGTILDAKQATECLDAGAEFLVSPGLALPVLQVARDRGKLAIPGALTPTELMAALAADASVVKIFPCGSVGGAKHIKALKAPFPQARLIPTGGVNLSNAAEYLQVGAFALGLGGDLCNLAAVREGRVHEITRLAQSLVAAVS